MELFFEAYQYYLENQGFFWEAMGRHLALSLSAMAISVLIGIPLGIWISCRAPCRSHCLRCFTRPGWPACNGGFQFKEFKQLGTGPLRYDALKHGEIDIALVFTTEARIAADKLVVLRDDKGFYPIYNIALVIRQDTLQKNPKIAEALNKLAPLLTDDAITSLNAQVDIDKQEFAAVAKTFLNSRGLLKK